MILFLHGPDTFRSRGRLREIIAKFRRDIDPQGYNITVLRGGDTTCQAVVGALSSAPFMSRKRMVVLEEYTEMSMKEEELESLVAAASAAMESETVFVVWEEKLDKKTLKDPFVSAVSKTKFAMEFPAMDQQAVASWMRAQLKTSGVDLDAKAWQYVSVAVDDNVWQAAAEVQKLIAFAQSRSISVIDFASIKSLVAGGVKDDVFALVDAVSQGRLADALKRLHDQLQAGSHELEIVSLLIRQYRILQQVHDGLKEGLPPDSIARLYKIHPFVVKKMTPQVRRLDASTIRKGYGVLTKLDGDIKRSGLNPSLLLSTAVAKLAAA
jgi:DNA polymerase-3 subunit delta